MMPSVAVILYFLYFIGRRSFHYFHVYYYHIDEGHANIGHSSFSLQKRLSATGSKWLAFGFRYAGREHAR